MLVIQAIALAIPAFFVYKIACKFKVKERMALVFAIGYLLYPGTLWPNWYDFHLEAFTPLFLSMAYYFYFSNKKTGMVLSLILLLSTIEEAAVIVVFFVGYVFLREVFMNRRKLQGSTFLTKRVIISMALTIALSATYYFAAQRIMNWVWPQRELLEPTNIFGPVQYNDVLLKVSYLAFLSAPIAFLSFDSPLELVPAVPYLFLALASNYQPYFTISWQYPALISIPFFVAAIAGYTHYDWRKMAWKVLVAMLLFTVLFAPVSPLMSKLSLSWSFPVPTYEIVLRHDALTELESNATVLAQEDIFPNIAERKTAYTLWPSSGTPPDYILVDVLDTLFYSTPETTTQEQMLSFLNNYDYGIVSITNGFIVLKKDYHGPEDVLMPFQTSLDFGDVRSEFISFEDTVVQTHFFVADWVKVNGNYMLLSENFSGSAWWGPYVTLPPGKYRAEIEYSVAKKVEGPVLDLSAVYWNPYPTNETIYGQRTILGNETEPGQKTSAVLDFELKDWVPALEFVGTSYGATDLQVYSVKLEEVS